MWNKLMSFFGNAKVVDLDNDGKIETLRAEVEGVFSQFKRMHDKLDTVIQELEVVTAEEIAIKEKADKRIVKAQTEIELNKRLQEKVKDFIL